MRRGNAQIDPPPPQEKLPSKSPALLGLIFKGFASCNSRMSSFLKFISPWAAEHCTNNEEFR